MTTSMADLSAQLDRLMQRSVVYRLLSRAYRREPDEDFLAELESPEALSIVRAFSPQADIDALTVTGPGRLDQLAVEFCRLFIGPGPHLPPYESVHRSEPGNAGRLWGEATVQLKRFVESLGLHYSDDFHEMPDHVSVELELMYRLVDAEAEALQSGHAETRSNARKAQIVLFREHMGAWLPTFCDRLQSATNHAFYAAIAVLTRDLMTLEKALLEGNPA